MPERGFDIGDVEKILTTGMIRGEIKAGKKAGNWDYLVVNTLDR
jgi:hypothetical protein